MDNAKFLATALRSIFTEVVPCFVEPVIRQGIADGSITTAYPTEVAESCLILLNLWAGIFSRTREDFIAKFRFLKAMTDALGVPVFDEPLLETLDAYYTRLAHKLSAQ